MTFVVFSSMTFFQMPFCQRKMFPSTNQKVSQLDAELYSETRLARISCLVFSNFDVLAMPTSPSTAFKLNEKLDDPMQMYLNDN